MFSLLLAVWVILFVALVLSATDYICERSFIKTVLTNVECRVGVGLWVLLLAVWLTPIGFAMIHDFQMGGKKWVGSLLIFLVPLIAAAIGWASDRIKARENTEGETS
jgi:L-cystine uptake protein TcyP (sodium:dicarboxylate symporter family)